MTLSPNVEFMLKLRKIDGLGLTVRDVIVIYTVMANPGINGIHLAQSLSQTNRTSIVSNVARLARLGLIEDRRQIVGKAQPSHFYITQAGIDLWNGLKPGGQNA